MVLEKSFFVKYFITTYQINNEKNNSFSLAFIKNTIFVLNHGDHLANTQKNEEKKH
jgi:hypothetical protein